ncbi:hypothetical protein GOBAR_AA01547 [Gossypium barbadense]|uniref:Uncharacterized protein n=1 Tax=Gossypium barbadense TaxID=3634 RepID=A0A2P5YTW1_GOSBA|nr:hypothetical protein GOBAR_AA01547 [Gossypium barbadense]
MHLCLYRRFTEQNRKADVGAVGARESGAQGVLDVSVDVVRKIWLLGTACGCYSLGISESKQQDS